MPFLMFLSGGEALEEWKSPGHILILLGFFAFGLLCVYGTYKVRKDYKRIQNGELVAPNWRVVLRQWHETPYKFW